MDRPDLDSEMESIAPPELIVPPFAARCLEASRDRWESAATHAFVARLADGSLNSDQFRFYQMQDARYLEAYADTCSILSTRFPDPADKLWFIDGARLAIVVEQELHTGYGEKLGYTPDDVASLTLTPNNLGYQNHMVSLAQRGSLIEALAALAPCPWLYTDIGQRLASREGGIPDDHPYADWLRTYADPSFVSYTNDLLAILQRVADAHAESMLDRAVTAFQRSVQYEWMFWDQALNQQEWPV